MVNWDLVIMFCFKTLSLKLLSNTFTTLKSPHSITLQYNQTEWYTQSQRKLVHVCALGKTWRMRKGRGRRRLERQKVVCKYSLKLPAAVIQLDRRWWTWWWALLKLEYDTHTHRHTHTESGARMKVNKAWGFYHKKFRFMFPWAVFNAALAVLNFYPLLQLAAGAHPLLSESFTLMLRFNNPGPSTSSVGTST